MDTIAVYFLEDDEEDNGNILQERIINQNLRSTSRNIFQMDENSFRTNFRLNKRAFQYVLQEVEGVFSKTSRSTSLTSSVKLAACLRFFAQGSHQQSVANDYNVNISQSAFSKVLSKMLNVLEEKLCAKWIKIAQTNAEQLEAKQYFYEKSRIPGIVMCIDGTHIKILQPKENKHLFYNRKGYYSMNAMIMCDHKQYIKFIDGRFQGANHDSYVWNLSTAREHFKNLYENGQKNTRILGDAGYPLEPWLLTPFRNAVEGTTQARFNKMHTKGRILVERTIGLLKNRFRCLHQMRSLHYDPPKVIKIINVCCALHNICLHYGVLSEDLEIDDLQLDESTVSTEALNVSSYNDVAVEIRNRIAEALN